VSYTISVSYGHGERKRDHAQRDRLDEWLRDAPCIECDTLLGGLADLQEQRERDEREHVVEERRGHNQLPNVLPEQPRLGKQP